MDTPVSGEQPKSLEFVKHDREREFVFHSDELLMEAALNAWEYVNDYSRDDSDTAVLPSCAAWGLGVVQLRHAIIYMAPSILLVYDELCTIEDHLPCYDFEIVPAIVRRFDRYISDFSDIGMGHVVSRAFAHTIAQCVEVELREITCG